MERPRPAQPLLDGLTDTAERLVERFLRDVVRATPHFDGRTAREGEHQYASRVDTVNDEMRHAVCERICLAGAGPGDDQQRTCLESLLGKRLSVGHSLTLRSVQLFQV